MPRSSVLVSGLVCAVLVATALPGGRAGGAEKDQRSPSPLPSEAAFLQTVKPFFSTYCTKCHGAEEQKGERRFDRLSTEVADDDALVDMQDALDLLNLGEMPPVDAPQPTDEERLEVIGWLTGRIDQYHREQQLPRSETVLRRLNAREYRNTVRDLLQLNMTMFDPTAGFPRDQTTDHLDNVGSSLVTSGHLLQRYMDAADKIVNKAAFPIEKPAVQTWIFEDGFQQQPEIDQVHRRTNLFEWMTLYEVVGADKHEGAYGHIHDFAQGVPYDGFYEIRFQAEALNRHHPYGDFFGTDPEEPFRLGIVPGHHLAGHMHKPQPIEPLLTELELADELKSYTVRVWLDAGFSPRFTFRNGPIDVRNLYAKLVREFADQFPERDKPGIVEARYYALHHGKMPQIRIHQVEIEGPFYESWPRSSQRAMFGEDWDSVHTSGSMTDEQMRRQLRRFMTLAYRRPSRPDEVDRLMQLIAVRRAAGRDPTEAYADALKAVLCSPSFLYLEESDDAGLSSYALASRLSYFLWASMPDQELMGFAEDGRLQDDVVLQEQVERMLRDSKMAAFVDGFMDSWLTLRDLGSMPPDRDRFADYYQYDLQAAMREETRRFIRYLVRENESILNFIDSDFTFVNRALARHYGIDGAAGSDFARVQIGDRRRGGLLGQASVLTVSANGIDTSPVVRGVWLLENLLGTPPSPPPPDVEPLDPDVRGAVTIRDQLQKHRDVASCYDCHRKIDPLGFALENFDPIGRWRETYGGKTRIDASGELPSGHAFTSVEEFKAVLLERQDQFAVALTEKLLAYAVGRPIEPADRPHVDRIVQELASRGYGMRDLIHLVVASEPFQMP